MAEDLPHLAAPPRDRRLAPASRRLPHVHADGAAGKATAAGDEARHGPRQRLAEAIRRERDDGQRGNAQPARERRVHHPGRTGGTLHQHLRPGVLDRRVKVPHAEAGVQRAVVRDQPQRLRTPHQLPGGIARSRGPVTPERKLRQPGGSGAGNRGTSCRGTGGRRAAVSRQRR
jgi:hypothetical protein